MKKLITAFLSINILAFQVVACSEDQGDYGLGRNPETGESYVATCGNHEDGEEHEHEHDPLMGAGVVMARYHGAKVNTTRGCYHDNTTNFTCVQQGGKSFKFVQQLGPGFNVNKASHVNMALGIAQGYNDIDAATNYNLQSTSSSAKNITVKIGYSTGTGGTSVASGGPTSCSLITASMPTKMTQWCIASGALTDYNLDEMEEFSKFCFGNNPTNAQYQSMGRLFGRHETMHALAFHHTSSNLPNSVMKSAFGCSDMNLNISSTQAQAANTWDPGNWDSGTLIDIAGMEH